MAEDSLTLLPCPGAAGTVTLPGSKSLTNRALLLSALAAGTTRLTNVLDSDDTRHMRNALEALGVTVAARNDTLEITGVGGAFRAPDADDPIELFLGNSGTSTRSLTAVLAASHGDFIVSGDPRMHERPIGDLVDALAQAGADIEYMHSPGYPPLRIRGHGLRGTTIRVSGALSSQFLSGLLMTAPLAADRMRIEVEGRLVSAPYIRLTLEVMRHFGVAVRDEALRAFEIDADAAYVSPGEYAIEGDASGASYFLAAGAIGGGPVRVEGAGRDSLQGDVAFADVLEAMGARVSSGPGWIEVRGPANGATLRGVDMDLNHIPDAAMTLAVVALFARGSTRIRNVYNWRVKETDRLSAMARELRKIGATVEEAEDSLTVHPPEALKAARIETYDDHRIAMCFALVAFGDQPVTIMDPACVNKTFPTFFAELDRIRARAA